MKELSLIWVKRVDGKIPVTKERYVEPCRTSTTDNSCENS